MKDESLLLIALQVMVLGGTAIWLGSRLCERWGLRVSSMGGKGAAKPAPLGFALLIGFLPLLYYYVVIAHSTEGDRLYSLQTQTQLVGALCLTGLVLLIWGWRVDRNRSGLESILVLWGCQVLLWAVGLRIDRIGLPEGFEGLLAVDESGRAILPGWSSLVVTLLWTSVVASVIELLDGVDSMAAWVVAVASVLILIQASSTDLLVQLFSWGLACSALGVAWMGRRRGKFTLGKNGSYLLGFWFAALTILARQKGAAASLLTPVVIIGLIAAIVLFTFIERSLGFSPKRPQKSAGR